MTETSQPISEAQAKEIVERLLMLAGDPDSPANAAEIAGLLGDVRPLARHWSEFPRDSVIAYVLSRMGRPAEALRLGLNILARRKEDAVASEVVQHVREDVFKLTMEALHMRRPDVALRGINMLQRALAGRIETSEERALQDLVSFVAAVPQSRAVPPVTHGRPTVIHLGIWGQRFVEAAERYFFACCRAAGNVPELARYGTVIFHVHTREADVDRLMALRGVQELRRFAEFRIEQIPERLFLPKHMWGLAFWNRLLLSAAMYDSLMMARSMGADFCSMGADVLMSDRCLSYGKKRLVMDGVVAVAAAPIRATAQVMEWLVEQGRRSSDGAIAVAAADLYKASLRALHPLIRQSFVRRTPNALPVDPVQFFFRSDLGFVCRTTQLHAGMFSTKSIPADIGCDYHTFDCRILSDLLAGCDPVNACHVHLDPPGDMFYLGIDEQGTASNFGEFRMSPKDIGQAARKWINREEDLAYLQWLLGLRFNYPVPRGIEVSLPDDCLDEQATVSGIINDLKSDAIIVERIRAYRRAA